MPQDTANPAPPELLAVADSLGDFSDQLDDYIKAQPDLFTPAVLQLRSMDTHIASAAAMIAQVAVTDMAADVPAALGRLGEQIASAKATVANMTDVGLALSVVAAVLSVAASISTGNPLSAASSVAGLAQTIAGAVKAAEAT